MEIISSGIITVPAGVSSTGLYFIQEGVLQVVDKGWAQEIGLAEGGQAFVSSGGILYLCTVSSGGTVTVLSGGYAQDVTVENGGLYLVSSGGTAHKSLLKSGGTQIVRAGEMAASVTVMEGGVLHVSSGGYARNPVVSSGGFAYAWANALIDNAKVSGTLEVNANAAANSVSVLDGGKLAVLTGGYAYEAKISSGGTLDIASGGRANFTKIYESGTVMVSAGASCNNAEINGGTVTLAGAVVPDDPEGAIIPGGFASKTTVNSGGYLYVSSGATATKIKENGGYVYVADGADVTFIPNTISGLVLSNASATVHAGTTATDTTVDSGGKLFVSSGGTAQEIVENGGYVDIADGADVSFASNTFSGLALSRTSATIHSGTTANSTTVNNGGNIRVSSGGFASNTTVNSNGRLFVSAGGMVNNTTINSSGIVNVFHLGSMNDTTINSGGSLVVSGNGEANRVFINSAGEFTVKGIANDIAVNSGGMLRISDGGIATEIKENGGNVYVEQGRTVSFASNSFSGLILSKNGPIIPVATIHSGTTANNTTVEENGQLYVFSSGLAISTIINSGGRIWLASAGLLIDTTVNSRGYIGFQHGGSMKNFTVCSGGRIEVDSGGTLTGQMIFEEEALVNAYEGAILDFDISGLTAEAGARVNNLAIIQGMPVYTLTVSAEQAEGVYTLAEGAAEFNSTLTVQNTLGEELGTLAVGEKLVTEDTVYTLNLGTETAADALTLTVEQNDTTAPVIKLDADTETTVRQTTLTATVDDGSTIQYRIGEFGLWKEYKEPIIASLNETYYFMATDEAGNEGTSQITFGNIDTSGILLSTLWSQRGINPMGGNTTILFNEYTPLDPSVTPEAHSLTGCVNTAAGQLIYYFIEKGWLDLPLTLKKSDEYTSKHKATEEGGDPIVIPIKADGTTPGTLSFAEINAMLSDYQLDSAEHAAALLYAIGVVLESKYSANSTGTSWNRVFFKRAGFEGETMGGPYFGEYYWGDMDDEMQYTITDAGFEVLIENLEAGLPVGATYPGHAFVIDGYDRESDTFHINLGWGGNQATRWYTRDEMQEELNCEYFVYDLNPEYVETFTVTDARVYGTGTMIRAFERAAGMIGDNTVAFDPSVAGKTVELLNHITFFDEVISVKDFNMNVLVTESQGGENSYGFYADHLDVFEPTDPATVLTFHASGGSLIVSTEKEFNYAFQMEDGLSCTVDANGMLIYAGKTIEGTDAAAVLQALQTARSGNTEVSGDLLDSNGWSYNGSAGEDVFRLSSSSLAVGNVSLDTGNDVLSLRGHSRLYGTIDAGDGDDSITVDSTSSISGDLSGKSKLNFVLTEREDHAMFTVKTSVSDLYANTTLSVDMSDAVIGIYTLVSTASGATGIADLQNMVFTVTGSGCPDFTLSVNGTSTSDFADLIYEDNSLKLKIKAESGSIVAPQTQIWAKVEGATQYIVEYSMDNFGHVIQVAANTNSLDSFQMPAGKYQVRVKADDGEWTVLEPVVAGKVTEKQKLVRSNADGNADMFFVNAVGTWKKSYAAQHVGSADDPWGGTKENVMLVGKNKLTDVFEGSDDANTLLMTDDANGDALFVDDIYSALPGPVAEQQSRIARIDEIRAGAGNDIVDMTSNKFKYTGDGLTIRGGDGDDVIWANKGGNLLFGDA